MYYITQKKGLYEEHWNHHHLKDRGMEDHNQNEHKEEEDVQASSMKTHLYLVSISLLVDLIREL